jgi:protein TonB
LREARQTEQFVAHFRHFLCDFDKHPVTQRSSTLARAIVADPKDRFLKPIDPLLRYARRRFISLVIAVCLLHATLLAVLLLRDHPPAEAPQNEIPIEVVVLPPPPPEPKVEQPKPKPPPQPKEKAHYEEPATSAPPPPNDEKLAHPQSDQATLSPVHGNPMPNAAMKPVPDPAKPSQNAAPEPAERTAAPDEPDDKPDAEALSKAAPMKDPKPTQKEKPAKEKEPVAAHEREALAREFASLSQAPNFSIAAQAKPSRVTGGQCHANPYLCTLFGLIMRQQRYPESARVQHLEGTVAVAFWVDERGDLVHQALYKTSGHPELDAEAVAAVRRAAPFPPPPPGLPRGFVAQMEFPSK